VALPYQKLPGSRELMLQVHALSAVDVPEIAAATRRGLERVVTLIQERTGVNNPFGSRHCIQVLREDCITIDSIYRVIDSKFSGKRD